MSDTTIGKHEIEVVIGLTRRLRDDSDIWPIFKRVGFREYMNWDEIVLVSRKVREVGFHEFRQADLDIRPDDWLICIGLLERLADGMLTDADLEGQWVANFVADRWHTPDEVERDSKRPTCKPTELGWVMALAKEIDADPRNWDYFINLTDSQHGNPRERPLPNPIEVRKVQFKIKHCLHNRDSSLGIWPLLYSKFERYSHLQSAKIEDITDIEQVKRALAKRHKTKPSLFGGFNLDVYFEDLNR